MNGILKKIRQRFNGYGVIVGVVIVMMVGTLLNGESFLTINNISNVGRQATIRGLLACGMALVIMSGSIDLSVSTLFAFSGFLSLYFSNYSAALAFVIPMAAAAGVGFINATLIVKAGFHPWIVTIASQLGIQGILLMMTRGDTYKAVHISPGFATFGKIIFFRYISIYLVIFILTFVVFAVLLKKRSAFRNIYAVGGNEEAATMMGINVYKTRLLAHMLCSMLACLAGILLVSRTEAAYPLAGTSYEMYAIAACALGGIYLTGGRGKIMGAFAGAWILGFLNNIFNMQSYVNPLWEQVVTGLLLIIVVFSQSANAKQIFKNIKKSTSRVSV
ncbi:ABC transporter permease [Enterocloster sp. OA13]|uniref:ABC transporter permease n=1 Tax=Enterocloster sp. OA13 TaxID=2914161 RepID=UPI00046EABEC|nr:ABC transporter permease [Enterocloster sp. OA13]